MSHDDLFSPRDGVPIRTPSFREVRCAWDFEGGMPTWRLGEADRGPCEGAAEEYWIDDPAPWRTLALFCTDESLRPLMIEEWIYADNTRMSDLMASDLERPVLGFSFLVRPGADAYRVMQDYGGLSAHMSRHARD